METQWGKVKKLQIPPLQEEGGGQQLNINELTIGTLQVSTFMLKKLSNYCCPKFSPLKLAA